jgi:membrane-bound lytic murein transglycosylase B
MTRTTVRRLIRYIAVSVVAVAIIGGTTVSAAMTGPLSTAPAEAAENSPVAPATPVSEGPVAARSALPISEAVPPPAGDPIPDIDVYAPGRPAEQLRAWASARAPALHMPVIALEAYAYAAKVSAVENPDSHLAWTTLAGIGMVESLNGTFRATIEPNGDVSPPIRGVPLDGTNGNMLIADSNGGGLDGDARLDRAMGPMQFIAETWRLYGRDANHDGVINADNIYDAALAAADYLCSRGGDLATPQGWITAIRAYNNSDEYVGDVRDWATAYANGHPL